MPRGSWGVGCPEWFRRAEKKMGEGVCGSFELGIECRTDGVWMERKIRRWEFWVRIRSRRMGCGRRTGERRPLRKAAATKAGRDTRVLQAARLGRRALRFGKLVRVGGVLGGCVGRRGGVRRGRGNRRGGGGGLLRRRGELDRDYCFPGRRERVRDGGRRNRDLRDRREIR